MNRQKLLFILILLLPAGAFAQSGVARFLSSGFQDVNKLAELYMEPFGKGFGTAMNSGWYNTARAHKPMGFDVSIHSTLVTIPSDATSFDLDSYGWNVLLPGSSSVTPNIAGTGSGVPVGIKYGDDVQINDLYDMPKGVGFSTVPLPMVQLGVGIVKNTDITIRFFPELELGDLGRIGMFGFGIKHDIKQWIPGVKKMPFDLSVQAAWSRLAGTYNNVEYYPTKIVNTDFEVVDHRLPSTDLEIESDFYRSQDLTLTSTAMNANLIVSKRIAVLTGFASIGYSQSTFNIGLNGDYLIPQYIPRTDAAYNGDDDTNDDGIVTKLDKDNVVKDPIDADITYSSINAAVGLRLNLGLLTLHGTYVYQDYSMINFGMGISFR
ncbi:MAG: DUF6588 family protein [Salinivirgaceae bacterium]